MSQLNRFMKTSGNRIAEHIRAEAEATEAFVRDVRLFLESLPDDLGRGSLNGMKAQLVQKCADYLQN